MANNQAFLVSYEGFLRNNNPCNPYKAVVHTADEAIVVINTWHTYGHHDEFIVVNDTAEKKIRELFSNGFVKTYEGNKSTAVTLRTTGCGCWDIVIRPALADTLEEHNRIYNEQREAAKQERMRQAEVAKQRRLVELNEQKRGWYHVELELRLSVFNNHGNDYRTDMTFSGNVIADSGMDAYDKAVKSIHNEGFTHRGNIAMLESWAESTSNGYEFLFLGVKTDDGYSVEKWEEWKAKGEI
ncbi:MAG: hypothetical protein K6A67_10530 [Bacteroidales bacterium]|nr:hypothetical protein [Bacteroidales bacterium]